MDVSTSFHDLVATTLTELGLPAPTNVVQTMLMRDSYFVGHKLRYDGGHAILRADGHTIEFYDEKEELLKTVTLGSERGAAA